MRNETSSISSEEKEEEDGEEYEDDNAESRFVGFMFGNVDNSGMLDVDYFDEDAKGHLSALANKLGPSFTDFKVSVKERPSGTSDANEQEDFEKKSENAVNYEDIDEEYVGPEVQGSSEKDWGFVQDDCFYAGTALAGPSVTLGGSILDEDNYDEEEEDTNKKDTEPVEQPFEAQSVADEHIEWMEALNEEHSFETTETELETTLKGEVNNPDNALPILCKEDGKVVLRFSEIFGAKESYKIGEKKSSYRYSCLKDQVHVPTYSNVLEEDEELFLKGSYLKHVGSPAVNLIQKGYQEKKDDANEDNGHDNMQGVYIYPWDEVDCQGTKHSCLAAQPMKNDVNVDFLLDDVDSFSSSNFLSLDHQQWEAGILWDTSSASKNSNMVEVDEDESPHNEEDTNIGMVQVTNKWEGSESDMQTAIERSHANYLLHFPILESFDQNAPLKERALLTSKRVWHPQMLRLELLSNLAKSQDPGTEVPKVGEESLPGIIKNLKKLSLQNTDLVDGSWVDSIMWDDSKDVPIPKLIFNLQDEQMLFEIVDAKEGRHLRTHAAAMMVSPSSKAGETGEFANQAASIARFNISNDKYYSIRKTSQQQKSHTKKRASHGIKIVHSLPAMRLQTMKPKLSNKDLANFHRPKALWYPHHNEVAAKEQGNLFSQGPMKIIVMSMGGKASKLHVDAAETLESVKGKAAKKLDFKPSENIKFLYCGRKLQEGKSLSQQDVRPNSILHLVRTKVHPLPRAQRLPGENKPVRPPGAFKKKSELSVKDGHVFLMEYCEERPLLLGNAGMGARLSTYYQKQTSSDQHASTLRNEPNCVGTVIQLEPTDKSPFLGDIRPGCSQSCLETNMYRAPVFPHKVSPTDFLLVRSAKGKISLRRIDHLHVVGQQEPHMEVLSPGSKNVQNYIGNRLLVYVYREFRASEKPGSLPFVCADELAAQFPNHSESFLRKRLKHCADLQKGPSGEMIWFMRRNFRIPSEEELRRMVTPENVCAYESMQAGLYHLKRLGINKLTMASGLASAMNQLPDEAIALAAASHIERELQITAWNLSCNFVASTMQGRECIERLEITGSGDPSGRGLGFSFIRVALKPPISSALVKKKAAAARGGSAVTGTDADLRRLSMDAAREVLLKFNVDEEQIEKMTRWHRIAMVRKLSSEQAASGVKVDATTLNKFARGQRMSFLQLQQQTREKCQEIWDRQLQSLSAADFEDLESDVDANSDLDSFAGDLENLLDAEEGDDGEEGDSAAKKEKREIARGYGARRRTTQAQAEEEIEDEEAEAAELCRMLMDDDDAEEKKKKRAGTNLKEKKDQGMQESQELTLPNKDDMAKKTKRVFKRIIRTKRSDGTVSSREVIITDPKEVAKYFAKNKGKKANGNSVNLKGLVLKKKNVTVKDTKKVLKGTKLKDKPVRESFICGACGQAGHMRTNKKCPLYNEDLDVNVEKQDGDLQKKLSASGPSGEVVSMNLGTKSKMKKIPVKNLQQAVNAQSDVQISENVSQANNVQGRMFPLKFVCKTAGDKSTDQILVNESNYADVEDEFGAADETKKQSSLTIGKKVNVLMKSKKPKDSETTSQRLGYMQSDVNMLQSTAIKKASEAEKEHKIPKVVFKQPKEFPSEEQRKRQTEIEMQKQKEREEQEQLEIKEAEERMLERKLEEALERQKERKARGERMLQEERGKKRINHERERQKRKQKEEETVRLKMEAEEERRKKEERQRRLEFFRQQEEEDRQRRMEILMQQEEERQRKMLVQREEEERQRFWAKKREQEMAARREREEFDRKQRQAEKQKERERMEKQRERERENTIRTKRKDRRQPERERGVKRHRPVDTDRYSSEYSQPTKRRRGGEVFLANILENIVDKLRDQNDVSYLFLKPVTKKEAPDYSQYVKHPMDLGTIKEKVKTLQYKNREQFREDVILIVDNAHTYNDGRNPGIPPLADRLLEICDDLLETRDSELTEAESGVERI